VIPSIVAIARITTPIEFVVGGEEGNYPIEIVIEIVIVIRVNIASYPFITDVNFTISVYDNSRVARLNIYTCCSSDSR
jgi:hypothetical protein